jgi:hypothetical protein
MELSTRAWGDPDIQWAINEIKRLNYEIGQLTMRIADTRSEERARCLDHLACLHTDHRLIDMDDINAVRKAIESGE